MSQLTAQDLQYIDLVLAGDLMNPIWSFEMNVELKWSVVQSDGQTEWPVLLAQDGGDEEKYGYLKLNAPGGIGERIAGMFYIADSNGDPLADKGAEYPPTAAFVSMLRVSDDPSNPNYNLYYEERNRPVIITHKPTAELTGLPPDAIVLSDDIIGAVATYCDNTLSPVDCGTLGADQVDILTYAGAANPQGVIEESEVINLPYVVPIDDVRIVTTVGYLQSDGTYTFDPDTDTFHLQWTAVNNQPDDPDNLFLFQIVNSNPNIVYPDLAFVRWAGQIVREGNTALNGTETHQVVASYNINESGSNALVFPAKVEAGKTVPPAYVPKAGKRAPNPPYILTIRAELDADYIDIETDFFGTLARTSTNNGRLAVETTIRQDVEDIIVQEYWDHYPYSPGNTPRKINCVAARIDGVRQTAADGSCKHIPSNVHPWPTSDDIIDISLANAFTSFYTELESSASNCGSSKTGSGTFAYLGCGPIVFGNYYTRNADQISYKINPLAFANDVRFNDNLTTGRSSGGPSAERTPIVNSGWRNPERNEFVGGVINSNHQWQPTLDLKNPASDGVNDEYLASIPDEAATTWCTMAHSARLAGASTEIIVENNRTDNPNKTDFRFMYYYRENSVIDSDPNTNLGTWNDNKNDGRAYVSCTDAVRRRIEQCLSSYGAGPYSQQQGRNCSPDHIHAVK